MLTKVTSGARSHIKIAQVVSLYSDLCYELKWNSLREGDEDK